MITLHRATITYSFMTLSTHRTRTFAPSHDLTRPLTNPDAQGKREHYFWPMAELMRRYSDNTAIPQGGVAHNLAYCPASIIAMLSCRHDTRMGKTVFKSLDDLPEFAGGTPPSDVWAGIDFVWPQLFLDEYGPRPDRLISACCGQFAVSKERIRAHPLSFYRRLYDWILTTNMPTRLTSRIMEYLWAFIFGEGAIVSASYNLNAPEPE
jgi:hypothetical protein